MDPISFTASLIAVATLATQCARAFSALRAASKNLPGRLHALNNEVTDINAVLTDVAALVRERGERGIAQDPQSNFPRILTQLTVKLTELKSIVESLTASCSRSKIPLVRARAWTKVQEKLLSLQEEIKSAKSRLNVLLGASNSYVLFPRLNDGGIHCHFTVKCADLLASRDLLQIRAGALFSTQLQDIQREGLLSGLAQHHDMISGSLKQVYDRVDERIGRVEDMIKAQETRLYESQEDRLGPHYGAAAQRRRRRSKLAKFDPVQLQSRPDAVGVRLARYATTCRSGCPCACHKQKKSSTPAIMDRVFGQLFVGYAGVPGLSPKCDEAACEMSQTAHVNMEYWFPLGFFWSQIVRLQIGYQPHVGPQLQLSMLRRIPDSAQSVDFALGGNIDGLKDLFKRGQASPRDVSSTRGYSLLRWALYGKQYDTCRFLLHAGADPDYRPVAIYDNTPKNKAHDFLLQGSLTENAEEVLRQLTQGSDWIDEQNYTLLHKSVLGLSMTKIEDAILQHPDDVDTVDGMGRTPLCWAAARGDDRTVAILLAYGADPNTMDVQITTAVSYAAEHGYTKVCRLLLEAGADLDPKLSNGLKTGSALNCAARNSKDPLCFKTLLDFGADIESSGVDGKTSLIHVARTNNVSFALLLLEYGADINAISITGQTPLTTAIMHNSHRVLRLLLERWFEYSECPRLQGAHLLEVVAEYADHETISLMTATDHLRLKYDNGFGRGDYIVQLRDRFDADEKLVAAFEHLLDVVNTDPDTFSSAESLAEAGMLDHRARALRDLGEVGTVHSVSDTESDEAFEIALEHLDFGPDSDKTGKGAVKR